MAPAHQLEYYTRRNCSVFTNATRQRIYMANNIACTYMLSDARLNNILHAQLFNRITVIVFMLYNVHVYDIDSLIQFIISYI